MEIVTIGAEHITVKFGASGEVASIYLTNGCIKYKREFVTYHARLESVEFLNGYDVARDSNGAPYAKPHWQYGEPTTAHPVAYTRGSQVEVQVKYWIEGLNVTSVTASVSSPLGAQEDGITLTNAGGNLYTATFYLDSDLPDEIRHYEAFAISVPVTIEGNIGDGQQVTVGSCGSSSSSNTMYVTLEDPAFTPLYHTLLDIGCQSAAGMDSSSTVSEVVDAVYARFETRNVKRVDGVQMGYWLTGSPPQNLAGLMASPIGDGSCIAWAELFYACVRAQGLGVNGGLAVLVVEPNYSGNSIMLIPQWTFTGGSSPCGPFFYTAQETMPGPRVEAQGNTGSPEAFFNHWIVGYQHRLFDPSYGSAPVTMGGNPLLNYEAAYMAGYGWNCGFPVWDVFKENDPSLQEMDIVDMYTP